MPDLISSFESILTNAYITILTSEKVHDSNAVTNCIPSLCSKYKLDLEESIRYIYLPYMADQRLLTDLFTELYAFRTQRRYSIIDNTLLPDIMTTKEILKSKHHIAILGEPGAGKTTFLRRVALSFCEDESLEFFGENIKSVPVLLECRGALLNDAIASYLSQVKLRELKVAELKKEGKTMDYINRLHPKPLRPVLSAIIEKFHDAGFPYAEKLIMNLLISGNVMLFIDGLDETAARNRVAIADDLSFIKDQYRGNRAILTCRTAEAENLPMGFTIHEIAPLNEQQKVKFVRLWFSQSKHDTDDFLTKVTNTHIWNISDRPLLLTLLCALYEAGGDLPRYKVDLYKECSELALKKWDAIRFVKRSSSFRGLSTSQRMDILSKLAAGMTLNGETQLQKAVLSNRIAKAMEEAGIEGTPVEMINEIVSHTGLLQQVGLSLFAFSHKSLQEFFAARYFAATDPDLPINQLKGNVQWLVTAEMTASMVPDATSILLVLTSRFKREGKDQFTDLKPAIKLIYDNPITISNRGREILISRILNSLSEYTKEFEQVVILDKTTASHFSPTHYSSNPFKKLEITTGITVYLYFKLHRKELSYPLCEQIATSLSLVFRLLIPSVTVIEKFLLRSKNNHERWLESMLMSALINIDPFFKRQDTKHLLSDEGKIILSNLSTAH